MGRDVDVACGERWHRRHEPTAAALIARKIRAQFVTVLVSLAAYSAGAQTLAPAPAQSTPEPQPLEEVIVTAPEPRYVAPTLRDRIGRVWAPVYVNGEGPLRLVLDTGATRSAVTVEAATRLKLPVLNAPKVLLRGMTGEAMVPLVDVESIEIGDLTVEPAKLLVVQDAFGGAEGVLAARGLKDRRILIEFRKDHIEIVRSKNQRALAGFTVLPIRLIRGHVPSVRAVVGNIEVKAIIDTGAQQTTGNLALREALIARRRVEEKQDKVIGVTGDIQEGPTSRVPPIYLGNVRVSNAHITFVDLFIFKHWRLTDEPAIMLGMDVLGVLDTLILDYRRKEMQIRLVN
ncbi:MAG: aspartyl protease family protein [Steroidobacteraceae bacterium]|nr:aspartyl protease family protein [Steroidobacteraceae bacterium]